MRQVNIVGTSPPSQPSRKIQTLPAPPDMAPANVTLRTASETSLWLRWMVIRKLLFLCISSWFIIVSSGLSITYCGIIVCILNNLVQGIWFVLTHIHSCFLSQCLCAAFAWMGIQWERGAAGLQGSVLPCWFTGPGADPCHCWPSGKRVHYWGLGGVDRIWGQGPGCEWHWDGTMEPAGQRQDEGVWWVRTSSVDCFSNVCGSDDDPGVTASGTTLLGLQKHWFCLLNY